MGATATAEFMAACGGATPAPATVAAPPTLHEEATRAAARESEAEAVVSLIRSTALAANNTVGQAVVARLEAILATRTQTQQPQQSLRQQQQGAEARVEPAPDPRKVEGLAALGISVPSIAELSSCCEGWRLCDGVAELVMNNGVSFTQTL